MFGIGQGEAFFFLSIIFLIFFVMLLFLPLYVFQIRNEMVKMNRSLRELIKLNTRGE